MSNTSETFISNSTDETLDWAKLLGAELDAGTVIALHGDLGCGKTVIAKGIAAGLGLTEDITSPTFTMLEEYHDGRLPFYHFDLYRIENPDEYSNLNFEEYWEGDGVSVIEWPERAAGLLPKNIINIYIDYLSPEQRRIRVENTRI